VSAARRTGFASKKPGAKRTALRYEAYAAVAPDELEVDTRLREWARWASAKRTVSALLCSAERAYRSPQVWDRPEPRIPVILHQALVVERAVNAMPAIERLIICMWYIGRASHRQICNKLRMSDALFAGRLRYSRLMVRNILRYQENERIVPPTIWPSPRDVGATSRRSEGSLLPGCRGVATTPPRLCVDGLPNSKAPGSRTWAFRFVGPDAARTPTTMCSPGLRCTHAQR
jgi:hypothetical protein